LSITGVHFTKPMIGRVLVLKVFREQEMVKTCGGRYEERRPGGVCVNVY